MVVNVDSPDTLILGAGIAGLTAAYQLRKAGYVPVVLEAEAEIGGRVKTRIYDGVRFNMGAGFVNSGYKNTLALLDELGLTPIQFPNPALVTAHLDKTYHYSFGHLYQLFMAQPVPLATKLIASLRLPLVAAQLRQHRLDDLTTLQRLDHLNAYETMRDLLGKAVVDLFIDPLAGSLIFQSIHGLSLSSFYAFVHMALLTKQYNLPGSLAELARRLSVGLEIRCNCEVLHIARQDHCVEVSYCEKYSGTEYTVQAQRVISTLPADLMASLLASPTPAERAVFENTHYGKSIAIIVHSVDDLCYGGTHLVFPIEENPVIAGVSKQASKLYLVNLRDSAVDAVLDGSEGENGSTLPDHLRARLADLIRSSSPLFARMEIAVKDFIVWKHAIPKFAPGHNRRLAVLLAEQQTARRLWLAGDYLMSPNIEGAITTGTRASALLRSHDSDHRY